MLNVLIPLKMHALKLIPQCDGIWRWRKRPQDYECQETSKDWKRPGNGFSQETSRRNAAIPTPDLSPESDFRLLTARTVRNDVFKPLSLW